MGLELDDLHPDPVEQFSRWFEYARAHSGMSYPNAACLSTVAEEGMPDGRIVLLRHFDVRGFCFYTNLDSPKGRSLREHPKAALTFYWDELQRQVRLQGIVTPVSLEEANEYFATRPRNSQIGSWASEQSRRMESREVLETRFRHYEEKFAGAPIPRPPHWSGFRIEPRRIEFWQEREFRLHDRFVYLRDGEAWRIERLSP